MKGCVMKKLTNCKSCAFFEDHITNKGSVKDDEGLCRFNPPVTQPAEDKRALWPVVTSKDWCAQFTEARIASS